MERKGKKEEVERERERKREECGRRDQERDSGAVVDSISREPGKRKRAREKALRECTCQLQAGWRCCRQQMIDWTGGEGQGINVTGSILRENEIGSNSRNRSIARRHRHAHPFRTHLSLSLSRSSEGTGKSRDRLSRSAQAERLSA